MSRRYEIVPAGRGTAVVETYLGGRRTAMTRPLPLAAARLRGEALAVAAEVVDHTHDPVVRGAYDRIRFRA
jgi:hypothetical protein